VSSCIRSCVVPARSASSPLRAYGRRNPRASRKCRLRKARCGQRLPEALTRQRVSETPRTCFEGPFGEVIRGTGPMAKANPFRFSTKYQDDETDLLYYGYRYYSASIGRWTGRDPISEEAFWAEYVEAMPRSRAAKLVSTRTEPVYSFLQNAPLFAWDLLGLYKSHTPAEYLWCAMYPCCCLAAKNSNRDVSHIMDRLPGGNGDDTKENAIKHCTWMCYVASLRHCSTVEARALGRAHEVDLNSRPEQTRMDLANNEVGFGIGGTSLEDCFNKCRAAAEGGRGKPLTWIEPRDEDEWWSW